MADPTEVKRVIIDTDGGVDDAAALWWAVTNPRLDVVAVTTVWGNVGVDAATKSVVRVLDAVDRERCIPVAVGARSALGPAPDLPRVADVHAEDSLGSTDEAPVVDSLRSPRVLDRTASETIQSVLQIDRGEVWLLTLGPLTNIAGLLAEDDTIADSVAGLVVMGGSARAGGNSLPAAEFNVAADPVAAAFVANAAWSAPPVLIGLDVTHRATLTEAEFELLRQHRSAAAAFLDRPLHCHRELGSVWTAPLCPCHDLVAAMALAYPSLIETVTLPLAVDTGGSVGWGATVVDFRPPLALLDGRSLDFAPWRVALNVDVARFRKMVRRLFGAGDQSMSEAEQ